MQDKEKTVMLQNVNKPFSHSYLKMRQEIESEANAVRNFIWPVITVKKAIFIVL